MRSTFKSVVVVLSLAVSLSIAAPVSVQAQPHISVAGRQIEPPDFGSFLKRFIKQVKHWIGAEPDGDSITVPRP